MYVCILCTFHADCIKSKKKVHTNTITMKERIPGSGVAARENRVYESPHSGDDSIAVSTQGLLCCAHLYIQADVALALALVLSRASACNMWSELSFGCTRSRAAPCPLPDDRAGGIATHRRTAQDLFDDDWRWRAVDGQRTQRRARGGRHLLHTGRAGVEHTRTLVARAAS